MLFNTFKSFLCRLLPPFQNKVSNFAHRNKCSTMLNIKSYRSYLEKLVRENSSNIFLNGGVEYASVFMTLLFSNTQNNVNMFCEGLNPEMMDRPDVFDSFKGAIERGVNFRILMEKKDYMSCKPFCFAKEHSNVEIRCARKEDLEKIDNMLGPGRCNFSVCDNKMVRLEVKPSEYKAVGSFNKPDWAGALNKLFDESFSGAEPLPHYEQSYI